jgi:hypothetical protein
MASSKQLAGLIGPTIVTLAGWFPVFMVLEGILLLCGMVLTFKAYTRREIGEKYTAR